LGVLIDLLLGPSGEVGCGIHVSIADQPARLAPVDPLSQWQDQVYRHHAQRTGVNWNGRVYKPGEPFAAGDDVNRLLSAGHSCLYGVCHAAIVGIGASPALGFVHTGGALSFVLDIADLYKATYTIPLAFDLAARGLTSERDARLAFRDRVADGNLMATIVRDIKTFLLGEDIEPSDNDINELWDETRGSIGRAGLTAGLVQLRLIECTILPLRVHHDA
jgi:CRISPR associated protein Cas1